MYKQAFIIFSGYNPRSVISFCRILETNEIPFFIIAKNKDDHIFSSIYKNSVFYTRQNIKLNQTELIEVFTELREREKVEKLFVAPTSEYLNRFFLDNSELFQQKVNLEIPLMRKQIYEQVSNKESFLSLCKENKISVPLNVEIKDLTEFPVVAKPRNYFNKKNQVQHPVILSTRDELNQFMTKSDSEEYIFQEFIGGECYYLLYYFRKNGEVVSFSQKNYCQQSGGKSILAATSARLHHSEISDAYVRVFKKISFQGFVMVELKKRNSDYFMIEANPRFWGPFQLLLDSKSNLLECFLEDLGFKVKLNEAVDYDAKYFWFGGLVAELRNDNPIIFHDVSKNEFYKDLDEWLRSDVYKREDTLGIFIREIEND